MLNSLPRPPAWLARLGRRIPAPWLSLHSAVGLELLRRGGWLMPPAELDGRRFAIVVKDLGWQCRFACRQGRFVPVWDEAPADLCVGAEVADFLALARGRCDADTLFFQRRLSIEGDTELGLIVKNWLDAAERPQWLQARGLSGH